LKLSIAQAKPTKGSIKNPMTNPSLSVTFESPFTKQHAKTLDCRELFNADGGLRKFTRHGLGIDIPEACITIQAGPKSKTRDFTARATVKEIEQLEGEGTIQVVVKFAPDKLLETISAIFGEPHEDGFHKVTFEGKQGELEFEAKDDDEDDEQEPLENFRKPGAGGDAE
jgi:hypothetical protein